jgi:hypothetical protein
MLWCSRSLGPRLKPLPPLSALSAEELATMLDGLDYRRQTEGYFETLWPKAADL